LAVFVLLTGISNAGMWSDRDQSVIAIVALPTTETDALRSSLSP
jgi:hypothetical protein